MFSLKRRVDELEAKVNQLIDKENCRNNKHIYVLKNNPTGGGTPLIVCAICWHEYKKGE